MFEPSRFAAGFPIARRNGKFQASRSHVVERIAYAAQSGLKVLAGAAQLEDWQHGSQPAIERLVEIAQQSFDFVVMDFGSFYSSAMAKRLQAAEVLLVSEADLPGLAKLQRHLRALGNLRVSCSQVRLVINRWHRHDEGSAGEGGTGHESAGISRGCRIISSR